MVVAMVVYSSGGVAPSMGPRQPGASQSVGRSPSQSVCVPRCGSEVWTLHCPVMHAQIALLTLWSACNMHDNYSQLGDLQCSDRLIASILFVWIYKDLNHTADSTVYL